MTDALICSGRTDATGRALRFLLIATVAFLTLVDLFAKQVIISGLTRR